ncbi:hypothetical protein [Halorubrum miltondacostae]|uniref:S1 motif domain-containing protein n=1 Tax=Halorubrum miltondacostae TaxID=3076378 RepID=A0ABD5M572_9EURY
MPVIHRYTDKSGIYLRSSIDGTFVTFQLTPAAERFLRNQKYSDGDSISWSLIKPLWEEDHVYTGESGTTFSVSDVQDSSEGTNPPTDAEVDALNEFLNPEGTSVDDQETPQSNKAQKTDSKTSQSETKQESHTKNKTWEIPTTVRHFLNNTASGVSGKADIRRLIDRTKDRDETLESIQQLVRHPIQIEDFSVDTDDFPCYDLNSREIKWKCCDKRGTEADFVHTISANTSSEQVLKVQGGGISSWTATDGPPKEGHLDKLLEALPPIFEFHYKFDQYCINDEKWTFSNSDLRQFTESQRKEILEKLDSIRNAIRSVEEDEFVRGRVVSLNRFFDIEIGDSGIYAVGHRKRYEGSKLSIGDEVGFTVNRVKDEIHAHEIQPWEEVPKRSTQKSDSKDNATDSSEDDERELPIDLPEDILSIIEGWIDDWEQFSSQVSLTIDFADQGAAIQESIRKFSSNPQLDIVGLEMTDDGNLSYRLSLQDEEGYWICIHHLTGDTMDFEVEIHPREGIGHAAQIVNGKYEYWRPISPDTSTTLIDRHEYVVSTAKYVPYVTEALSSFEDYTVHS